MFEQFINTINDALYSYVLIIILVLGGLYFTFRTKFVQFRLLKEQFHAVMEKPKDGNGVSSFQALMVSTASRVGTGNIIGVSTALLSHGRCLIQAALRDLFSTAKSFSFANLYFTIT